ncbi:hypothetical protein SF06_20050 [Pseudomonas flexibilis]|nr:hypothetical protein SF06_20050 [Pseudomonas flexibilis]
MFLLQFWFFRAGFLARLRAHRSEHLSPQRSDDIRDRPSPTVPLGLSPACCAFLLARHRTCYKPQQKLGAGLYDRKKSGFEAYRWPMLSRKRRAGSPFRMLEGFRQTVIPACLRHSGARDPPFRCPGSIRR